MHTKSKLSVVDKTLVDIAKMKVYVGIPQEKASRKSGEITNAELMYIHTNGSPLRHIPKRPVIEPAIEAEENKKDIADDLGKAARNVMDGDKPGAIRRLELAGMNGQNAARAWFEDPRNNWPPDRPATAARKGSDRPLIDTGQLRKSIIYVVRDK